MTAPEKSRSAAIAWFTELSLADEGSVGGKGANLGELSGAGFPVPPGFVITAEAFLRAMDAGGVRSELADGAGAVDPDDSGQLEAASRHLQDLVHKAGIPSGLRSEIADAYERWSATPDAASSLGGDVVVAVRSSAAGEDSADASFAGMNETYTNVRGIDQLIERVVDCWASLYAPAWWPTAPVRASVGSRPSPWSSSR